MAQGAGYSFNSSTVTGSKVRDLAGYFLHGTIVGSAAISSGGGKYGDGLHCTGGAMQVANIDSGEYVLDATDGPAVAVWVKLDNNTAAARCAVSAIVGSTLKWALYASNASGNVEAKIAGSTYSTTTSIRDGAYHHLLMMIDRTGGSPLVKIYVDGTQVLSTALVTTLTYGGNATMEAGRNALTAGEALTGIVDDLRWWNDPVDSAYIPTLVGAEQVDFQFAIYPWDDDTCEDFSIYNRDLTKASTATYGVGLYGRAISSSATEAAASAAVNFGDLDRLAITGWMRLDTAPSGSAKPILSIKDTGGTEKLRVVVNLDRTITSTWLTIYGSYSVTSGSALTVGQWSRFQIAMNPTYVGIRLNSTTQAITNTSNPVPHLSPAVLDLKTLYVGGDSAGGGQVSFDYLNFTKNFVAGPSVNYWAGPANSSAVKPSNVARGVYEMNEGSGTTTVDKSPYGNNLTLQTAGSWVTGVQGTGLGASGTGPGASKASGLAWSATPLGWAAACWAKVHVTGSGSRIIALKNGTSDVAHLGYLSGALWARLFGSGGTTGVVNPSVASFPTETWTHIAASCNGETIQFFVNGEWKASAPYSAGTLLSPTILNVGSDNTDDSTADTDSIQLFDTPISRANVLWLYQNPGMFAAGVPVTQSRSTSWRVAQAITSTRSTTWNTKARVTQTRATTWNVSGALVAVTKALSSTWNVLSALTSVTASRVTTWRTLSKTTASRSTSWNVASDVIAPDLPTKRVKFPTYQIPLGRGRLLSRYLIPTPSSLVKVNGEWVAVTGPALDLLEVADAYFIGGYTYLLTDAEVAALGLPAQYVEPIT